MKKILLILVLGIFFLSFVSSATFVFKSGQDVDLKVVCYNNGYCTDTAYCNASVFYPNNTALLDNIQFQNQNAFHNYTIDKSYFDLNGDYRVAGFCEDNSVFQQIDFYFTINGGGKTLTTSDSILYIGSLFILIFLFILTTRAITQLPNGKVNDEELFSTNHLKFVKPILYVVAWGLLLCIMYVASNFAFAFLNTELLGNVFLMLYKIMLGLSLPMVFFWLVWLFVRIYKDKEFKRMIERGADLGGTP